MNHNRRSAAILYGGWDGHDPSLIAHRFKDFLEGHNFTVHLFDTMEALADKELLLSLDLFIPVWTAGKLEKEYADILLEVIGSGVGLAGCHGGMCDAFRESVAWQFMTGGNWVSHPGGDDVTYEVTIRNSSSPLVADIADFTLTSEQYYLHVDPAVEVLATTEFPTVYWYHSTNGKVQMPVVWTKRWGHGRVFYNSLGHKNHVFDIPEAWELMKRGMLWAADGKREAVQKNLTVDEFISGRKMF